MTSSLNWFARWWGDFLEVIEGDKQYINNYIIPQGINPTHVNSKIINQTQ